MVKLNTTYDKTLRAKIFVLKGDEAYARTTDVLASLISDYVDCNNKKQYARVGLEIEVLREVGDGFIHIYDNDIPLMESIPWSADNMATVIDSDWNDKGVYWIGGKLIIGKDRDDDESYGTTGFMLPYDVEHNIVVRYSGNESCLGSVSETLDFYMETPSAYDSTITLTCPNTGNRYHTGATINNVTVTYHSAMHELTKKLRIYVDGTQFGSDITVTDNTASTLTLGTLSDGKHTISAEFIGDEESAYAKESIDISVGYKFDIVNYPVSIFSGSTSTVTCSVLDYLDSPVVGATVVGVYQTGTSSYTTNSDSVTTTLHDFTILTNYVFNGTYDNKIRATIGGVNYYSSKLPTNVVTVSSVSFTAPSPAIYGRGQIQPLTGSVTPVADKLPVSIVEGSTLLGTTRTDSNGAFSYTPTYTGKGDRSIKAYCNDKYGTASFEDVMQYWDIPSVSINQVFYYQHRMAKVNNGYKLEQDGYFSVSNPSYDWENITDAFEVSFEVMALSVQDDSTPTLSVIVGFGNETTFDFDFDLSIGDTVSIEYYPYIDGGLAQAKVNNVQYGLPVHYNKIGRYIMVRYVNNGSIVLNKFKLKGLE